MDILDPKSVDRHLKSKEDEGIFRISEMRRVLDEEEKEINHKRESNEQIKKAMEEDLEKSSAEYLEKKNNLSSEIKVLEERKAEALKPIDDIRKEAEELLISNQKDRAEIDRGREELAHKADELSEKEIYLNEEASRIKKRELKLFDDEKLLRDEESRIHLQRDELNEQFQSYTDFVRKRKEELDIQEDGIKKISTEVKADKEYVEATKTSNAVERKRIESQQQTLRTAFEEARKKNLL